MKVLLIDPYVPYGKGLNTGLGWLSASVKAAGYEVFVCDLNNRDIASPNDVLKSKISTYKPDVVGINIQSNTYTSVMKMFDELTSYYDGIKVVGGPQMAYEKENILFDNLNVDFALVGEAEESFIELLECLEKKRSLDSVDGLIYRQNNKIVSNKPRSPMKDLNVLPMPDYQLFGVKEILVPYRISTSRGCPYRCVFCNPFMGGRWRSRKLELAIEELKLAKKKYNIRSFTICEPVFNISPQRVIKFCELLIKERINLPWSCSSGLRADAINDEMLVMMKRTGCSEIKIGVETLVPEVFKNINKGESIADIRRAVEICKRNGMKISGSFIIGLPGDSYRTALQNLKLARELRFDETAWSLLIPYPGTAAYEWVKKNGRIYNDYKEADQYAGQEDDQSKIKVAFDTEDFMVEERLKVLKLISFKTKSYVWVFVSHLPFPLNYFGIFWNLMKYDFFNFKGNFMFIIKGIKNRPARKHALKHSSGGIIFEDLIL